MRFLRSFVALGAAALGLGALAAPARAQKALVYCPVGIDVAGCTTLTTSLAATFPDGVDRGYDGTDGTVDLASADLSGYALFVVPSLADGSSLTPYGLLRTTAVRERLRGGLTGRIALWSGTPDLGGNRAAKDALLRGLAGWAAGDHAAAAGPGLLALQDLSEASETRYDWVSGLTGMTITADAAIRSYDAVRALSAVGTAILGSPAMAYPMMATRGFYLPSGAAGLTLDAVGQTGTTTGGQVVLATAPAGNRGAAVVMTDRDDYAPGDTVAMLGFGFAAGETISLVLHEDPAVHENRTFTATADENGDFEFRGFAPEEHDVGVRFVLTATGGTSARFAQTTFTDGNPQSLTVTAPTSVTVMAGGSASYALSVAMGGNTNACTVTFSVSSALPAGASASVDNNPATVANTTFTRTLTIATSAVTPPGAYPFTVVAARGPTCQGNGDLTASGTLVVAGKTDQAALTVNVPSTGTFGQTYTLTTTGGSGTGAVTFSAGSSTACTIAGDQLSITNGSVGACAVTATKAEDATYNAATSPPAGVALAKAGQAPLILTGAPATAAFNSTFTVTASGGSGTAPVIVTTSGACSNVGSTVTMTAGTGMCTVTVSRGGDANYNPAAPATALVTATKAGQTTAVVVGAPASMTYGDPAATLTATGGDGTGTYAFSAGGSTGCSVTGAQLVVTNATGTCIVTATRAGDDDHEASASSAPANVALLKATAVVTLGNLTPGYTGSPIAATAGTTPAGLIVSITYDGGASAPTNAGSYAVVATVVDVNFQGTASGTMVIGKATATLSLTSLSHTFDGTAKAASVTTSPSGLTGLTVTYDGSPTAPTNAGSYAVVATLANDNYEGSTSGTLTIGKANATVSVTGFTGSYDGASHGATGTATGVAGEDLSGLLHLGASFTSVPGGTASWSFAGDGNYNPASGTAAIVIGKRAASVTPNAKSKSYGEADPPLDGTLDGFLAADGVTATYSRTAGESVAGSPYTIAATLSPAGVLGNYEITSGTASFTITPRAITVTADAKSKTYGAADPALTYAFSPALVGGDGFSGALSRVSGEQVGTYAIEQGDLAAGANYDLTFVGASLTIAKAPLTVTAVGATREYGDANPSFTASYGGFVLGETPSVLGGALEFATAAAPGSSVGSYLVTPGGLTSDNYAITFVDGTLTVTAAPLSVTADGATREYGVANPPFGGTIVGIKNADDITATYSTIATVASNVGSYPIVPAFVDPTGKLGNYVPTTVNGQLVITRAPLTVATDAKSRVYGAANPALTGSITGIRNGDAITATYATAATASSDVGTHAITATLADPDGRLGNYDVTNAGALLIITKAPLVVTPADQGKIYGETFGAFTGTLATVVAGDDITATYASGGAAPTAAVGTYPITATLVDPGSRLGNYDVTLGQGTLAVGKATLTVTADDASRVYGDANPTFTASFAGFQNGEELATSGVTGAPELTTTATVASGVAGSPYPITAAAGTLAAGNYAFVFASGELAITQRPVTVTADAQSKTYGDPDPALGYQITSGSLVNGDVFAGALARAPGETVGTYAIGQGTLALGGNYALTYQGAQLTIGKKSASVSPVANTKVYGAADPALTGALSGFLAADGVTATYARVPGETVGSYAIAATLAPAGVLGNYDIAYGTAAFTITPAPLVVTPNDKTIIQGGSVAPLGGTIVGLQFADPITATYATTADGMTAGAFPITATLADPSNKLGNYTLTQNTGTLTVTQNAAPVITALVAPIDPVQLGAAPTVSVTFTDADVAESRNYTVTIDWGNGTPLQTQTVANPGVVSFTYLYPATGVHRVTVTVSDKIPGNTDSEQHEYVVIYDPSGGFVTGGGWIWSPAGACRLTGACTDATGKATFGFNSKYQKGKTAPTGNTEFQFQAGGINFKSTTYEWLVVSGTNKAQFRGSGTINGGGDYDFILTAIDGEGTGAGKADAFRIKITDRSTNAVVYDNRMNAPETGDDATVLGDAGRGGGSIVIHNK